MKSAVKSLLILVALLASYHSIRYFYLKPKYTSGDATNEITSTLLNGQPFSLSSLKGSYVLLHFWGSWCGPCRAENPLLVSLYKAYQGKQFKDAKQFEIVSVGVEKNKDRWQAAIDKDGLIWPYHILQDQNFDSPIAKLYGVREIPTLYLIDQNQKVIFTNPSMEQVKSFLDSKI